MREKLHQQQQQHDRGTKRLRDFQPGDNVAVRQFRGPAKWAFGVVVQRNGPLTYMVKINNKTCHVHVDHVIPAPEIDDQVASPSPTDKPLGPNDPYAEVHNPAHSTGPPHQIPPPVLAAIPAAEEPTQKKPEVNTESRTTPRRNPQRVRKAPVRLDL